MVSLDSEQIASLSSAESIDNVIEEREEHQSAVEKIQGALSESELYVVKRLIYENATHKELAEELGITVWASQKRLERIRDKLGKIFPDYRS